MPVPAAPLGFRSLEQVLGEPLRAPNLTGRRLRTLTVLLLSALLVNIFVTVWLVQQPRIAVALALDAQGQVLMEQADEPPRQHLGGKALYGLSWPTLEDNPSAALANRIEQVPVTANMLYPSARWLPTRTAREDKLAQHVALARLVQSANQDGRLHVSLLTNSGSEESALISPAGLGGLSAAFWLMAIASWMVFSAGALVLSAQPSLRNAGFAVLSTCQSGILLLMALEHQLGIFSPGWLVEIDTHARVAFDIFSAAALAHVAITYPVLRARAKTMLAGLWGVTIGITAVLLWLQPESLWWLTQAACLALAALASGVAWSSQQRSNHAINRIMVRLLWLSMLAWCMLTLALWVGQPHPSLHLWLTARGVVIWQMFVAMMVLVTPWMAQSNVVLKEFTLLAASGAIAASLDLLFVTLFAGHSMVGSGLSMFITLGLYLTFRRWLLRRMPRNADVSTGQLFQRVYKVARRIDAQPQSMCKELQSLMIDVFNPLETHFATGHPPQVMLHDEGARLLIPLDCQRQQASAAPLSLVLEHAQRGQALFTSNDVQLARLILDQLRKALAYDEAVEQGRSEERLRIAQDLHDDIGARLLTLMYQAPSTEMEDYIRHTIQDLKTLTRGLAAQSHRLSEAAGEWKRDIDHRVSVAGCELAWRMHTDVDVTLSMVQWSGLTRILRELVSNAISHARARKVDICITLEEDCLCLSVSDDGHGSDPATWAHGLGLGGVRKRVKQLGGTVRWLQGQPKGIRCEVIVPNFGAGHAAKGQGSAISTFGQDSQLPSAGQLSH